MRKNHEVKLNGRTLDFILRQHNLYLQGKGGRKANFKGADLSYCDLSGLDLQGVIFEGANLEGAVLTNCNLKGANFNKSNCTDADFSCSCLDNADFIGAKMLGVCLTGITRVWTSKKKYVF